MKYPNYVSSLIWVGDTLDFYVESIRVLSFNCRVARFPFTNNTPGEGAMKKNIVISLTGFQRTLLLVLLAFATASVARAAHARAGSTEAFRAVGCSFIFHWRYRSF